MNYIKKINNFNNENWGAVHIAARRASKECLNWIIKANKILKERGKETFNLNLKVKNLKIIKIYIKKIGKK